MPGEPVEGAVVPLENGDNGAIFLENRRGTLLPIAKRTVGPEAVLAHVGLLRKSAVEFAEQWAERPLQSQVRVGGRDGGAAELLGMP